MQNVVPNMHRHPFLPPVGSCRFRASKGADRSGRSQRTHGQRRGRVARDKGLPISNPHLPHEEKTEKDGKLQGNT